MNPAAPTATVPPPANNPADQYAALKAAILGAQSNTAPGASPIDNSPEIAKLYSSAPAVMQSDLNSAGPQYNTGVQVANDKAAAEAARANARAAGAGKFQQIAKNDGGFDFIDPDGNHISAAQYAAATGTSVSELLKNSTNPVDIAYRQDAKQLQQYIQNKQNSNNDPKARQAAQQVETQVRKLYGIDLKQQNPNQVIQAFIQAYPTVYGGQAAGKQGGNTLLPSANSIKANQKKSVSVKGL